MIALDSVKAHLRIDGNEEDAYLEELTASAVAYAEKYTGMKFFETDKKAGESGLSNAAVMGALLKRGCLLLIGHWYAARETVNVGNIVQEVPMASRSIFDMHRLPTL